MIFKLVLLMRYQPNIIFFILYLSDSLYFYRKLIIQINKFNNNRCYEWFIQLLWFWAAESFQLTYYCQLLVFLCCRFRFWKWLNWCWSGFHKHFDYNKCNQFGEKCSNSSFDNLQVTKSHEYFRSYAILLILF